MADSGVSVNGGPPSGAPHSLVATNGAVQAEPTNSGSKPVDFYLTDRLPHAMVLDALPYVDPLPAEQQQQVQQLLQQEMATIARESGGPDNLPDYLKELPLPKTPALDDAETMLGKEMARKAKGEFAGECLFSYMYVRRNKYCKTFKLQFSLNVCSVWRCMYCNKHTYMSILWMYIT